TNRGKRLPVRKNLASKNGKTEVDDLANFIATVHARDEHVGRRDVAMNDALVVRFGERSERVCCPANGFGSGQSSDAIEPLAERFALEHLHREKARRSWS